MGAGAASATTRQEIAQSELLQEFARLMRARYDADLYLFGSRARGTARPDSDYDIVAVSEAFAQQPWHRRCPDYGNLWLQAGGWRLSLDLHCYSPAEFNEEKAALGFVGQARARGELLKLKPRRVRTGQ